MPVQPIHFGDEGQIATRELLRRFAALVEERPEAREGALPRYLRTLESFDRQYGGTAALPVEDSAELVAATLTELAHLEAGFRRAHDPAGLAAFADLAIGVALWAMRHEADITAVEPLANALALRSNRAASRQELAAVFGLMQGAIEYVRPRLQADLERSNPERPWRILHANLAITAIRTEDPALIDYAFDALEAALPGERQGFYAEALALALSPGIAPSVRDRIEARHRRFTQDPKNP